MKRGARSPLRLLAPLSLIAFVVAFAIVLSNSGVSPKDSSSTSSGATNTSAVHPKPKFAHRRTYTVKAGDTLGAIAIKTGLSVSTLEDLNPGLDPQSLVAGQKLKLRQ